MKYFLAILFVSQSWAGAAQPASYLARITKYNETSSFEDIRYKGMDWGQFYKLNEANELVDPMNYDYDLMNAAVFFAINKYRASKGVAPLHFEPRLRDAACIHSDQMVKRKFFDHMNHYDAQIQGPDTRIELCGYHGQRIAENLAKNFQDLQHLMTYTQLADKAIRDLSKSREHNQHMLDPTLEKLGCGLSFENSRTQTVFYFLLTQDFGTDWKGK